jgi:hypothetical protein
VKEFRRGGFEPNQVIATFGTGGDDLRGGNDNVNLVILLRNGSNIRFDNVNDSNSWGNQTNQTTKRNLPTAIRNEDIVGVQLETTFKGGFGGDNWNLDKLIVKTKINGVEQAVLEYGHVGNLLFRFTGDQKNKEFKR